MIIEFNNPFNEIYDFIDIKIKDYIYWKVRISKGDSYWHNAYYEIYDKIFNNLFRIYGFLGVQTDTRFD